MQTLFIDSTGFKMDSRYLTRQEQHFESQTELDSSNDSPSLPHHQAFSGNYDFTMSASTGFDHEYASPTYQGFSPPTMMPPVNTSTLWPSQLTNLSPPATQSPSVREPPQPEALEQPQKKAPAEIAPAPTSSPSPSSRTTPNLTNPRKTLSDADRRRMCAYAQDNPSVKQTEIGSMFGVERSTVSKVLRRRDEYMAPEDGRTSPTNGNKKQRSKLVDVEKTLANWVKRRQLAKLPISDDDLRLEARKYATTLTDAESTNQVDDPAWLESFKAKYLSTKPRSEKSRSSSKASNTLSVPSPPLGWEGPAFSANLERGTSRSPISGFGEGALWGHGHSQSAASYSSMMSDTGFTTDYQGPSPPGLFTSTTDSPDPSPAMPAPRVPKLLSSTPGKIKRRQTMPNVGEEENLSGTASLRHGPLSAGVAESAMDISQMAVVPATAAHPAPMDSPSTHACNSPHPVYSGSSANLSANISPRIGSIPTPPNVSSLSAAPSRDETLAILDKVQTWIRSQPSGALDYHECKAAHKLMNILTLGGLTHPGSTFIMPDNERGNGTAPISRKRSAYALS